MRLRPRGQSKHLLYLPIRIDRVQLRQDFKGYVHDAWVTKTDGSSRSNESWRRSRRAPRREVSRLERSGKEHSAALEETREITDLQVSWQTANAEVAVTHRHSSAHRWFPERIICRSSAKACSYPSRSLTSHRSKQGAHGGLSCSGRFDATWTAWAPGRPRLMCSGT